MNWQERIDALDDQDKTKRWWYMALDFGFAKTRRPDGIDETHPSYGVKKWENYIKPYLPFPLKDKMVVDIGCNCALYSIMAAKEGANSVWGYEADPGNNGFYEQAELLQEIYYKTEGVENVYLQKMGGEDITWALQGRADIVFAFNVLYWMKQPYRFISEMDTDYLMVIGEEGKKVPLATAESIRHFLEPAFDIERQEIPDIKGGRRFNITVARAKK